MYIVFNSNKRFSIFDDENKKQKVNISYAMLLNHRKH